MSDITSAIWMYKFLAKLKKRKWKLTTKNLFKQTHAKKLIEHCRCRWPCIYLQRWHTQKAANRLPKGDIKGNSTSGETRATKDTQNLPQNSDSMLQTYFLLLKKTINKCSILKLEITPKSQQNNLPFCWKCILAKETLPATTLWVIKGFHLKCICMLTYWGEPPEKGISPKCRFLNNCFGKSPPWSASI